MTTTLSRAHRVALAILSLTAFSLNSTAQVVIQDDLSGNYVGIWGTTPEVNLPGGSWQQATGWYYHGSLQPAGETGGYRATMTNGSGGGINLTSNGGYTKPTEMTISATVALIPLGGATSFFALLGFHSDLEPNNDNPGVVLNSRAFFTGISIGLAGELSLYNNGTLVEGSTVAYGGSYVLGDYHTLSYTVNTATGAISNLSFQGSSADYSALLASGTPFSDANTLYAGIGAGTDGGTSRGDARFRDFSLVAVPEPGAGLLVLASGGLFLARRRR